MKAPHALDVPFTFDTIDLTNSTDMGPEARGLAATMSGLWAAFARTGAPEHPAVPRWPPYTAAERATLMLDAVCRIENDPRGEQRRLWQEITGTIS
jgi:para-nitrobenzyl esterase